MVSRGAFSGQGITGVDLTGAPYEVTELVNQTVTATGTVSLTRAVTAYKTITATGTATLVRTATVLKTLTASGVVTLARTIGRTVTAVTATGTVSFVVMQLHKLKRIVRATVTFIGTQAPTALDTSAHTLKRRFIASATFLDAQGVSIIPSGGTDWRFTGVSLTGLSGA